MIRRRLPVHVAIPIFLFIFQFAVYAAEPSPERQYRDRKVIEAVLLKVLAETDFSLPLGRDINKEPTIVLDPLLADPKPHKKTMADLAEQHVPAGLIDAMIHRNDTNTLRFSFSGIPFDRRIIVEKPRSGYAGPAAWGGFSKQFPTAKGALAFHLPGYSEDGKSAFVAAVAGPAPHGAALLALLKFEEGAWKVTWDRLVAFQ